MMLAKTTTDRQRYWLKHVKAADLSDGTIAEYSASHDVSIKGLYQWKSKLVKLKLYSPASTSTPDFVPVKSSADKAFLEFDEPAYADRTGCTVTLPNGTRLEFHGELSPGAIRSIMTSVGTVKLTNIALHKWLFLVEC